ncbi:S-type pyocin domain-containing protein [Streptomyces sp. NPDC096080]|uniref:S-type pyocin domain-containing protein n=1 Tax=Streptomyces sp. NPDC096080 TaxID=3156693 RepID=UPI0033244363
MRPEESRQTENVVPFRRPRTEDDPRAASVTADEPEDLPAMVLNAERGIINTGTVHGGQHITTVDVTGHFDGGARGDA